MTLLLIECGDGNQDIDRAVSIAHTCCRHLESLLTVRPPWDYEVLGLVATLHAVRAVRPAAFASAWSSMQGLVLRVAEKQAEQVAAITSSGRGFSTFGEYDLMQGAAATLSTLCIAGLRDSPSVRSLAKELSTVVEWSGETPHLRVPHGPLMDVPVNEQSLGAHVNLGLAHGVLGVLASLIPYQNESWAREPLVESLLKLGAQALSNGSTDFPVGVRTQDMSVHEASSPQSFSWCYGHTGLAVVAEGIRGFEPSAVHEAAAAAALSLVTTNDGVVVDNFDLAPCHGLSGSLLIRGQTGLTLAQIDKALGSIDRVSKRESLAGLLLQSEGFSLLEGLPGIALLGQLSANDGSHTQWEAMMGSWSRATSAQHCGP